MANGDFRAIPNTNRVVVEADYMGYVLEVPAGADKMDVIADFMAAWRVKAKRDRMMIAAAKKRKATAEARKRGVNLDVLKGLTDAEIEEIAKEERKPLKFDFQGFDNLAPEDTAALVPPVVAPKTEKAPASPK